MSVERIRKVWTQAQADMLAASSDKNNSQYAVERIAADIRKLARDSINMEAGRLMAQADKRIAAAQDERRQAMAQYRDGYDSSAALLADKRMERFYQSADLSAIWAVLDVAGRDGDLVTVDAAKFALPELVKRVRRDGLDSPVGRDLHKIEQAIDAHLDSLEPPELMETAQAIDEATQAKTDLKLQLGSVQRELRRTYENVGDRLPMSDVLEQHGVFDRQPETVTSGRATTVFEPQ